MTTSDLLVPILDLPAPVPAGAPVVETAGGMRGAMGIVVPKQDGSLCVWWHTGFDGDYLVTSIAHGTALNLAPPALASVDGLVVAAGMLGRAMGHGDGAPWGRTRTLIGNEMRTYWTLGGSRGRAFHAIDDPVYWRMDFDAVRVDALASIDPASPLADRHALAAILRARPRATP